MKNNAIFRALMLSLIFILLPISYTLAATIERVSIAPDGSQANANAVSAFTSISENGQYVAFYSIATNLVPGDTNNRTDVFVRSNITDVTERVSVATDGSEGNGFSGSDGVSISADGRYVAFDSGATNLVQNDTNGQDDIFVHDRNTGTTTRVSIASDGTQSNNHSGRPAMSADGRFVAFSSSATNLVPNVQAGGVFVHDRLNGVTELVSVATDGTIGTGTNPAISADGRYVVFVSSSSNLVPNDTNGFTDIFVHDRLVDTTERVSVASDGTQSNNISARSPGVSTISADGRYVVFTSAASNLVADDTNGGDDVFVHDRNTGITERVSVASDGSQFAGSGAYPSITADGRYVVFTVGISSGMNTLPQILIRDRETNTTGVISTNEAGILGHDGSFASTISANGQQVVFTSYAPNLVPGDTNGFGDVFVGMNDDSIFNHVPILHPIGNKTVSENQVIEFTVVASDPDNDALVYSVTGLPTGATFSPQTRIFSWTPTFSDAGIYSDVKFTVTDNGLPKASVSESITITVNDVNVEPLTLTTSADAYLRNGSDNRNEGANPSLRVQSSGHNRAVVAFDEQAVADYIAEHGISSAQLVFIISDNGNNWGTTGRTVDAHPLTESFAEGNGTSDAVPPNGTTRGEGSGVTWSCAIDTAIENQQTNCSPEWNGGSYSAATASSALITNNQTGEVTWDVTADVLNGSSSWLIKKTMENQNGHIEFYSKEGAAIAEDMAFAPRLILVQ